MAKQAVQAALEMKDRLRDMNSRRAVHGVSTWESGTGICLGPAVFGNIGSRKRWTDRDRRHRESRLAHRGPHPHLRVRHPARRARGRPCAGNVPAHPRRRRQGERPQGPLHALAPQPGGKTPPNGPSASTRPACFTSTSSLPPPCGNSPSWPAIPRGSGAGGSATASGARIFSAIRPHPSGTASGSS